MKHRLEKVLGGPMFLIATLPQARRFAGLSTKEELVEDPGRVPDFAAGPQARGSLECFDDKIPPWYARHDGARDPGAPGG